MKEQGASRRVKSREQDVFAIGYSQEMRSKVSKSEVADFCDGCDNLRDDGVCKYGYKDQARYVAEGWCDKANVNWQS